MNEQIIQEMIHFYDSRTNSVTFSCYFGSLILEHLNYEYKHNSVKLGCFISDNQCYTFSQLFEMIWFSNLNELLTEAQLSSLLNHHSSMLTKLNQFVCELYNLKHKTKHQYRSTEPIHFTFQDLYQLTKSQFKEHSIQNFYKYPLRKVDELYFDSNMLSDLSDDYDLVVLVGGCGLGKTTAVAKYLKEISFLSICYRISLCQQQVSTFKKHGCEKIASYRDSTECIQQSEQWIVQFDSLDKIYHLIGFDHIRYLYLDEISGLLHYICSSETFHSKKTFLYGLFVKLLKSVKHIVISDADITNNEIDFILSFRKKLNPIVYLFYNSNIKPKNVTAKIMYDAQDLMISQMCNKINQMNVQNETFIIASDSKRIVDKISQSLKCFIPTLRIYTSDQGDIQELSDDVDIIWEHQVVIYSPSITTGVDFTKPSHMFAFFTGNSITYPTMIQMIERARNKLSLMISVTSSDYKLTYYSYEHFLYQTNLKIKNYQTMCHHNLKYHLEINDEGSVILKRNVFTQYTLKCIFEHYCQKQFIREKFTKRLTDIGYQCQEIGNEEKNNCEIDMVRTVVNKTIHQFQNVEYDLLPIKLQMVHTVNSLLIQFSDQQIKFVEDITISIVAKMLNESKYVILCDYVPQSFVIDVCNEFNIQCRKIREFKNKVPWYDWLLFAVKCWKIVFSKNYVKTIKVKRKIKNKERKVSYPCFINDT